MRGNRTESLWEGNLPLRGSLRGPLKTPDKSRKTSEKSLKTSENGWKPLKTSKDLWKPLKTLPLRDPLRGRFPSQRLSVLLPLSCCPLNSLREFGTIFLSAPRFPHPQKCKFNFYCRLAVYDFCYLPHWRRGAEFWGVFFAVVWARLVANPLFQTSAGCSGDSLRYSNTNRPWNTVVPPNGR